MGRSLSLAAYRALSRRRAPPERTPPPPRPVGELVWAHVTNAQRLSAICDIGARLRSQRPGLHLLITLGQHWPGPVPESADASERIEVLGPDHPVSARQFLAHWSPDICLWAGGELMPNLISLTSEAGIPLILLDLGTADFPSRRHRWLPDLTRSCLDHFNKILANSESAVEMVRRIGISSRKVSRHDALRSSASPPPYPEYALTEVTGDLAGRPVWLAAHVAADEFDGILAAHRTALRLAHRLLLVVAVHRPADLPALADKLNGTGLRYAQWQSDSTIEDNTQVLISDDADDLGLWYRVAPLTFVGSSLMPESRGQSPLEAASLGSAVLFGPHVRDHLEAYARLQVAGAARTVRDSRELGAAVVQLVAPDQAAKMALAGWHVVSEGAELTDRLVDMVQDRLDMREAGHARP